ncbi:hypothetical protein FFF34_011515 [Inquilinus sp. KBS0705]|nr:hypothetical protein FFF34_011515 [Inquilinus sp. KBS0705]
MRVNRKWLRISFTTIVVISVAVALVYVDNLVNYNREVRNDMDAHKILNARQHDILNSVVWSKVEFIACLVVLIFTLMVKSIEPKFNNKLKYYGE